MEKFILTPDQMDFLKSFGHIEEIDGEMWYTVPFWFKVNDKTRLTELHGLGKLPDNIVEHINSKRSRSKTRIV